MKDKKDKIISVVFVLFFCAVFIYLFVDGAINIITRNKLEEMGHKVLVTVTDAEYVSKGENDYYLYTMEYKYNGKDYTYVDSSDHDLELGEQLTMYVDPDEPGKLHLPKDSMYLAFLALAMAIGFMYMFDGFGFFKRNIRILILCLEAFITVTGFVLKHTGLVGVGIILALLTFVFLSWLKKRRKQIRKNAKDYKCYFK